MVFKSTSLAKAAFNIMLSGMPSTTYDICITEIQWEEGSIASAWKPASVDLVSNANLTNNYLTKAQTESAIASQETAFNTKFAENEANLSNNYYTRSAADSAIATRTTIFESTLKSNPTNLLLSSNVSGVKPAGSNPYPFKNYYLNAPLVVGKKYTLVYEVEAVAAGPVQVCPYIGGSQYLEGLSSTTTRQIRTLSFTRSSGGGASVNMLSFYAVAQGGTAQNQLDTTATVYWAALYEGEILAPQVWTESVNDMLTYNLKSVGFDDLSSGYNGIYDAAGAAIATGSRGLQLIRFSADGRYSSLVNYDPYASTANQNSFIAAINALPDGAVVAITSYDTIWGGTVPDTLVNALKTIGVTELGSRQMGEFRTICLFVGVKGNSIGTAVELFSYNGSKNSPISTAAPINYTLQLKRGKPVGINGSSLAANTKITETTTTVDGIKALKMTYIDNNGVVSGYGLSSELVNGQVTSTFGVYATQFFVANPSSPGTTKVYPLMIDNGKVIMNTTIIKDGTIQNAQIGNLSADKITTGNIAADRMKANIVAAMVGQFTELSAITAKIGVLRTSTQGRRFELTDDGMYAYDDNGQLCAFFGSKR